MAVEDPIKRAEEYVDYLAECLKQGGRWVIAEYERNADYKTERDDASHVKFLHKADGHYFVARVLLHCGIYDYGFFCAQQCVENYLKAYLKFKNACPSRDIHDLAELLSLCRSAGETDPFLTSLRAEVCVRRYWPYYELARYPVQRNRPRDGSWSIPSMESEVLVLDYFVYNVKKSIPQDNPWLDPSGSWYANMAKIFSSHSKIDLIVAFETDNINFSRDRFQASLEKGGAPSTGD